MNLLIGLKGWFLWLLVFIRRILMISGFFGLMTVPISYDWAALLVRLAVGFALLPYPIKKFYERKNADHFPKVLFFSPKSGFYAAMIIEGAVAICLILGLFTRLITLPGIINMGVAFTVSRGPYLTSPAAVYFLMLIAILCIGGGSYSLDGYLLEVLR